MIEDPEEQKGPPYWICTCHHLTYRTREDYVLHLWKMRELVRAALSKEGA